MGCRSRGGSRFDWEEALHGFTTGLGTAATEAAVESALLQAARRIAPTCRVELVRVQDEPADPGDEEPADAGDGPGGEPPVRGWARRGGVSVVEVPIRSAAAFHGRLRLRGPSRGRGAVGETTVRRLGMVCTLAACALEGVRHHAEWQWHHPVAAPEGDSAAAPSGGEEGPPRTPTDLPAAIVRDATFLNAVLPFALSQAQRHRESLSLLCVGIDRLGAIQSLLGAEVAHRLVQHVGRTVAALVRSSDIVARLDDERLVALLVRARGASALHVARMICRTVTESIRAVAELPGATVSIGVAEFPTAASNVFSLLDAADEALAEAQSRGRNRAVLAGPRPTPAPPPTTAGQPAGCARSLYQSTTEPSSAS